MAYAIVHVSRPAEPAGAPLSLVVATQSGVERVWPAGGGARNRSLDALGVRALDFHYSNRYVRPWLSTSQGWWTAQ